MEPPVSPKSRDAKSPLPRTAKRHHARQPGVALISALLVVALASTAAAQLMSSQFLNLRYSSNLFLRDQAWQYLKGSEAFAMVLIDKAIRNNRLYDLLGQESAFPVEGGVVTGKIIDLQGRLNLNALVDDKGKITGNSYERLQNILSAQGVNSGFADVIVDWLDPDSTPVSQAGAEDDFYLSLSPPYRTANTRMESLSELMLLRGYRKLPEDKRKLLEQNLSTLPSNPGININSASDDLLKAIGFKTEGIQIIRDRLTTDGAGPFQSLKDIKSLKLLPEDKLEGLTTTTEYFQLTTTAQIGRARLKQYSIIRRSQNGALRVTARSLGTP